MKGIIYTVVTGGYDIIMPPAFKDKDWLYVLVTDREYDHPGFDVTLTLPKNHDPILAQRREKILMEHIRGLYFDRGYFYFDNRMKVIYHDGKLQQVDSIVPLADMLTPDIDLVVKKHPDRSCLYDEAQEVVISKKADQVKVEEQISKYATQGVPGGAGLVDTCILIRWADRSAYQTQFYKLWWDELEQHTHRDQLSFNAVNWFHPLRIRYFMDYSPYFYRLNHLK